MQNCVVALLCMFCLSISGAAAFGDVEEKKGEIKLEEFNFGDDQSKRKVIKAGKEVTFEVNANISEFFDAPIIDANALIVNKTDKTMQAMYLIVFMDKDGKTVGGHATSWTLEPKEEVNYGSAIIKGKIEDFKKVTQYRLYVTSFETVEDDL